MSYANARPKCNAYILVIANSKEQVIKAFGPYQDLLGRVEDAKSQRNGESIKSVSGFPVQKFPANFHIVSIILNK